MDNDATPSVERLLTESVWLTGLARSLLGRDEDSAEDVAQEARLAALQSAPKDPDHARAWLARVVRNFALRAQLRRTRRERRERMAAVSEARPSTLDLVERVNAQQRVAEAVVSLAEPYRSTVLLRYFDALPPRAIAAQQRVPIETVRTRLKRALAQLRARLDGDFGSRDAWAGLLLPWASPIEGAATSAAASSATTANAAGAGAAEVATNAATMSLTTKLSIAAAAVAAATLIWRSVSPPSLKSDDDVSKTARQVARSDAGKSAIATHSPAGSVDESTSNSAIRVVDAAAATTGAPAPLEPESLRVHATIVSAADLKPVEGATLTICIEQKIGEQVIGERRLVAPSNARGDVELTIPATTKLTHVELAADGFAKNLDLRFNLSQAIGRFEAGTLRLERGVRVKGRVLRGRDGEPIPHAELRLHLGPWSDGLRIESAHPQGESDATGAFVLKDRVWSTSRKKMLLFAFTDRGVGWRPFNVVGGIDEVDGIDVVVDEPATLDVTVRDDTGATVPSAEICCIPLFSPIAPMRHSPSERHLMNMTEPRTKQLFSRRSDAQGVATFETLPTGSPTDGDFECENRFDVVAIAEGHEIGFVDGIVLAAGGRAQCDVVLHRLRKVTLVGRVAGLDGKPIPGARVEVMLSPMSTTTTDKNGEYRVDGVAKTSPIVLLCVTADRHDRCQMLYQFDELPRAVLDDAEGRPLEAFKIDVALERSVLIRGRVVDEQGAPVAGAEIWFTPIGRTRFDIFDMYLYRPDPPETDSQGRFSFEATEGNWRVMASAHFADGRRGPQTVRRVKGGAEDLVLVCATRAAGDARLECEVVDAATGAPLPIAHSSVRPAEELTQSDVVTRCDVGRIEASHLDVNRWRLDVEVGDHRHAVREFDVTSDHDEVRLRIEIGAMARVAGRIVVDPAMATSGGAGSKKPRWSVWWNPLEPYAVDAAGRVVGDPKEATTKPDADGRFFLDGIVPDQTTRIFAGDGDQLFDEVIFTPKSGEAREVVLTMQTAARWVVERVDDFSNGNLVVDLAMGDEPWHREQWMDRMARDAKDFPMAIKPGRHRWRAFFAEPTTSDGSPPHVRSAEGEFEVAAGETYVLRLSGLR
jgi:RNA polymerase sigma factor (sigma-70 family)